MRTEQQIKAENQKLRVIINQSMAEIEKLKEVNEAHETEIETLLKFNERLLTIIETELNQYSSKKSEKSFSLQPISEITERDSEIVDGFNDIKNSLLNSIRLNDFKSEREGGQESDRVLLGQHLEDAISYSASRSEYMKQYSEYSQTEKVKQVVSLIKAYKKEYGKSIQEYEEIHKKIKHDIEDDNKQINLLTSNYQQFYGRKVSQLNALKEKLKSSNPSKQIEHIMSTQKYSAATKSKLAEIMRSVQPI